MSTKRLKILFLASWYPSKDDPIAGTFVQEHAKAVYLYDDLIVLHHAGWDPLLSKRWVISKEENPEYSLSIPTFHMKWRLSHIPRLTYLYFLLANIAALRQLIKDGFHPSVIHAHVYTAGVPAILLGKLFHLPVVITEHSTAFPRRVLPKGEISKARFAFQNSQKVIVVGNALQKAIESLGIQGKFQVIANAVDQELFSPTNAQHHAGSQVKLLYVNHIMAIKGLDDLITALSIMGQHRKDWHLDVVGDGPQKSQCEELISSFDLGNQITFHGYLPKQKIPEMMRQADIFVLPSHVETFSVVTAEALSCGLPVVTTRCGGPEEYVTPEVGKVVPVGKPEILADQIEWMIDHVSEFQASKIREYAENRFSLIKIGEQHHSLYESLLNCLV